MSVVSILVQTLGQRRMREWADSCVDNRAQVAIVRRFDWRLGGLIDKDPPAIPVTAPVREPARLTSDVSTGRAHSHPQHTQTHTHWEKNSQHSSLPTTDQPIYPCYSSQKGRQHKWNLICSYSYITANNSSVHMQSFISSEVIQN